MGLAEKYAAYQTFKENLRGQKLQNDERQRLADLQTGMANAAQNPNITTMQMQPEQPQLSLSALGSQLQPPQFQPARVEPSPIVDAYHDGRMQVDTQRRTPELAAFEYLRQKDPIQAQKYAEGVIGAAHNIAAGGDHLGAIDYVNKSLGLGLKYTGSKDNLMSWENADGTRTIYDIVSKKGQVEGQAKPMTLSPGSVVYDPQTKKPVFTAPKDVKRETRPIPTPDGKMEQLYSIDPNNPSDMIPVGKAYKVKSQVTNINMPGNKGGGKPLPASALKMQQEGVDAIGTASGIRADLGELRQQVETGTLDLGPMKNLINKGLNWAGWSTPQSRNLQSFTATLQKLRNDSLRLNKGVQTDGDAQRAWAELIDNINDPKAVSQRLQEIDAINERAVMLHQSNIDNIRNNYGLDTLDTSVQRGVQPAIGQGAKRGGNNSTPAKGKAKRDPLGIL